MKEIEDLLAIMCSLRDKEHGCPWDLKQTHESLACYALEEAYEVIAAIEDQRPAALCAELGDLLFQIVFHAQLASEKNQFDFSNVVGAICEKMTQRHPHVFNTEKVQDDQAHSIMDHNIAWEVLKRQHRDSSSDQKSPASVLDGIAGTLPAMTLSVKLQKRAASVGFDWKSITPIFAKVTEELEEVRTEVIANNFDATEDEIGDLLFSVVNLARHAEVDPESALRRANQKFDRRFRQVEQIISAEELSMEHMSEVQLEVVWAQVKNRETLP